MTLTPLFTTLWRPRRTMEILAEAPSRRGAAGALALGAVWAGFSGLLHLGGHAPSVTLVPIPPERYYLAQAGFAVPLWLALWAVAARVSGIAATALGGARSPWPGAVMGYALASPMIGLFLLPDILVYLVAGHDALGAAMKYYAPIAPLAAWALATVGLERRFELSRGRAVLAAFAGLLAQALLGAPLLR